MKTVMCLSMAVVAAVAAAEAATVTGRVQATGRPMAADVVTIVYAEPLAGGGVKPGTFTLAQRNKTFQPRVLPVPVGSMVNFPNEDLIFHNVFSLSRPGPFDLGLYRAGASQSRTFRAPAVYRIFCNIHPQMSAIVLVVPTSHVAEADASGNYRLDLPAGRYRVTAWSERSEPVTTDVTVGTDALTVGDLTLDESRFVAVARRNKFGEPYASSAYDTVRDQKPR